MDNEPIRADRDSEAGNGNGSRWREVRNALLAILGGGLALLGGCFTGANYGGNYAPDFVFLGQPGYQGSSLMAGLACLVSLAMIALLSELTMRRMAARCFTITGALAGMLLGGPLLFQVIAPSVWLLAAVYFGSAALGALIGWLASLGFPNDR